MLSSYPNRDQGGHRWRLTVDLPNYPRGYVIDESFQLFPLWKRRGIIERVDPPRSQRKRAARQRTRATAGDL